MKNYRELLKNTRFWNKDTEKFFQENGQPVVDCALQNREEIIALCEFIEKHDIRSYLEIGCWTGRLVSQLHEIFNFDLVAACDLGSAKQFDLDLQLPGSVQYFEGNSHSPIFENWRTKLGQIDLVFIDSDHSYEGIKMDFEVNARAPNRYIAIHGIAGDRRSGEGPKRVWSELIGNKTEIVLPHAEIESPTPTMGIGIWQEKNAAN